MTEPTSTDLAKGAAAGLVAGIVASWAMEAFQAAWIARLGGPGGSGDPATVRAATQVSKALGGGAIPKEDKEAAGEAVHYATGAALGLGYGMVAEALPRAVGSAGVAGAGGALGLVTAVVLDEALVPALGLGKPPQEVPAKTHAFSLASHLVFGLTAEATRRLLRKLI